MISKIPQKNKTKESVDGSGPLARGNESASILDIGGRPQRGTSEVEKTSGREGDMVSLERWPEGG